LPHCHFQWQVPLYCWSLCTLFKAWFDTLCHFATETLQHSQLLEL
jgi:hypothetical protein